MAARSNQGRGLPNNIFSKLNSKHILYKIGIVGVLFIAVLIVMSVGFFPNELEKGQVSPETIFAHTDVKDIYATQRLQEEKMEGVAEVYEHSQAVDRSINEKLNSVFSSLANFIKQDDLEEEDKIEKLSRKLGGNLDLNIERDILENIINMDVATIDNMYFDLNNIISGLLEGGIREEQLDDKLEEINEIISALDYSEVKQAFMKQLSMEIIQPNVILDEQATEEKIQEAKASVEPEMILEGEVIVREGERITEREALILEELGLKGAKRDYLMFSGLTLLVILGFLLMGLFIYYFRKDIFNQDKLLVLAGLILVTTLVIAQGVSLFSEYLIPVAMAAILFAVLFDARISIMFVGIISILVGIIAGFNFEVTVVAMASGFAGTFSVTRLQERGDLTRAGLYVALVNVIVIIALMLVTGQISLEDKVVRSTFGILNGFFSGILAIGLLPYLESGFGLTTPVRLLELSNPNHPLLKKLMIEAPGTYHHSVIVGNLAEAAAERVGADPMLARVGAYYHDVGKINRPYFFAENQFVKENPHDKISPSLSSLVIASHVKEGVELARQYKLPEIIQDIIRQHHGTNFVGYFFRQLQEESDMKDNLLEEDFKYKGPKPQTKEAAIVMLADSVEAAVRSMSNPTAKKIEGLVYKIVNKHLEGDQFSECHLTFKDLNEISKSLIQLLLGIYHTRVKYPEELEKRGNQNGIDNKGTSEKKIKDERKGDARENSKKSDRAGKDN